MSLGKRSTARAPPDRGDGRALMLTAVGRWWSGAQYSISQKGREFHPGEFQHQRANPSRSSTTTPDLYAPRLCGFREIHLRFRATRSPAAVTPITFPVAGDFVRIVRHPSEDAARVHVQ